MPYLNLAALDNAVARVKKSAKAYDDAFASFAARGTHCPQRKPRSSTHC